MPVTNLYNIHLSQILYSNDAPASLRVRFFIITHDTLLMHSNLLKRIATLSIMINGTMYISIQNRLTLIVGQISTTVLLLEISYETISIDKCYIDLELKINLLLFLCQYLDML